jgi:peptidoglycan/LPS O-acetylase OafA/YrhL
MTSPREQSGLHLIGNHLPALDGLRGVAILLVMFHHFTAYGGMNPRTSPDRMFKQLSLLGWIGVDLFFVLSGFLITGILCETLGKRHFFRNFYLRRTLRIFPVYYATLLVAFIVIPAAFAISGGYAKLLGDQLWYWFYAMNLNLAWNGWPEFFAFSHFWSLAVEEQFYLVWPLLIFAAGSRRMVAVCVSVAIAAPLFRWWLVESGSALGGYVLMPARCDALAIGGLIALLMRDSAGVARTVRWSGPLLFASSGALLSLLISKRGLPTEDPLVQTVGFSLIAVLFGAVLVRTLITPEHSRLRRVLESRAMRVTGRYSYALYIFHHPVAIYLGSRWMPVGELPRVLSSQLPGQLAFCALAGSVSFGLAWVSWQLIEAPFLRLKARFPYDERAVDS